MIPRIGRYWESHGGIYAGIVRGEDRDCHVIMAQTNNKRDVICDIASEWVQCLSYDGHADFSLPNRDKLALIYTNLRHMLPDGWYWTCEQYPADAECNWVVAFPYGRHADARRTDACKAIAVRTEPCE